MCGYSAPMGAVAVAIISTLQAGSVQRLRLLLRLTVLHWGNRGPERQGYWPKDILRIESGPTVPKPVFILMLGDTV